MSRTRSRWAVALSVVLLLGVAGSFLAQPQIVPSSVLPADPATPRPSAGSPVPFDAKRAMGYLESLCALGPRVSGSDGMARQQDLLRKHFSAHGGRVGWQKFSAKQVSRRGPIELANLIVTWHPDRDRRVILCGHYDTRPFADQEPDRRRWSEPFLSANDGTSTVAFFMELAHHMADLKLEVGVDFVLFDAEEYVFEPDRDRYFLGSEYFARDYQRNRPKHRYTGGILLDLFAGTDAKYPWEQNSLMNAGRLVQEVWGVAAELGETRFLNRWGPSVQDDHLALNRVGIPTIDIIDFDYPHWHRLSDVPANCSGESMACVARVVSVWLQRQR